MDKVNSSLSTFNVSPLVVLYVMLFPFLSSSPSLFFQIKLILHSLYFSVFLICVSLFFSLRHFNLQATLLSPPRPPIFH